MIFFFFFFQAEDGIRDLYVTGVQTCALPISHFVEHVGNAARHARAEIAPGRAEHDDVAPGHVLAAMVAHRLDDRIRAAVAHGKALARHAADVRLTARRAVKADVADDDVLLRNERGPGRREYDDLAARESLAEVIVGVAFECKRHATRHERAEALAGGSPEM